MHFQAQESCLYLQGAIATLLHLERVIQAQVETLWAARSSEQMPSDLRSMLGVRQIMESSEPARARPAAMLPPTQSASTLPFASSQNQKSDAASSANGGGGVSEMPRAPVMSGQGVTATPSTSKPDSKPSSRKSSTRKAQRASKFDITPAPTAVASSPPSAPVDTPSEPQSGAERAAGAADSAGASVASGVDEARAAASSALTSTSVDEGGEGVDDEVEGAESVDGSVGDADADTEPSSALLTVDLRNLEAEQLDSEATEALDTVPWVQRALDRRGRSSRLAGARSRAPKRAQHAKL